MSNQLGAPPPRRPILTPQGPQVVSQDDDMVVIRDPNNPDNITIIDKAAEAAEAAGKPAAEAGDDDDAVQDDAALEHDANLAEIIAKMPKGEEILKKIATDLIEAVQRDERSRQKWRRMLADGIKLMGVSPDRVGGAKFKGASRAVHPVLTEAMVQFQARAIAEVWPSAGPVKAAVTGELTDDLTTRQKNVETYMNWQYTEDMAEAFWEMDQLLFRLPLEGSCFKKQYFDAELMRTTTRFCTAEEIIVSDRATDLMSAPRVTHKFPLRPNLLKKYQAAGLYRDIDMPEPSGTIKEEDPIEKAIDDSEGREDNDDSGPGDNIERDEYDMFEVRCELDLDYFEDRETVPEVQVTQVAIDDLPAQTSVSGGGTPAGEPTGIALPYIVTINVDNIEVLAIRRNWKQDDQYKRRELDLVHYKYLPGLGFYGYGLLHAIGSLSEAASGSLRQLLDAGAFANMQGGFKSKDLKIGIKGEIILAPGQWIDIDGTADDLSKGFFPIPYKEPSGVMFQLLGLLVDYAQRFASTTEAMVGEASNTGPVGTTVALIEQGSKVFSGIHKRIHHAAGQEFRQIAALNTKHIPPEGITFNYIGGTATITRADFDQRISIIPVSDPNIISATQRIALAQGALQLFQGSKNPAMWDEYALNKRVLTAMNTPQIDEILHDPNTPPPSLSPLYENMAMGQGQPVRAYMEQDHGAHMQSHDQWFESLPPAIQQHVTPAYLAHKSEHAGLNYFLQMQKQIGVPLPVPPQMTGPNAAKNLKKVQMPQDVENKLARATVLAGLAIQQQNAPPPQLPPPQPGPIGPPGPGAPPAGAVEAPQPMPMPATAGAGPPSGAGGPIPMPAGVPPMAPPPAPGNPALGGAPMPPPGQAPLPQPPRPAPNLGPLHFAPAGPPLPAPTQPHGKGHHAAAAPAAPAGPSPAVLANAKAAAMAQAEARKTAGFKAEQQRKDAAAAAEQSRKGAETQADQARKDRATAFELARKKAKFLQDRRLADAHKAATILRG